jgi:hypothetical protein
MTGGGSGVGVGDVTGCLLVSIGGGDVGGGGLMDWMITGGEVGAIVGAMDVGLTGGGTTGETLNVGGAGGTTTGVGLGVGLGVSVAFGVGVGVTTGTVACPCSNAALDEAGGSLEGGAAPAPRRRGRAAPAPC